jgi:hypothetical protein
MTPLSTSNGSPLALSPQELAVIDTLRTTPYGSVEVVLHQSKIVQVVKTEKVRLEDPPPAGPPARR